MKHGMYCPCGCSVQTLPSFRLVLLLSPSRPCWNWGYKFRRHRRVRLRTCRKAPPSIANRVSREAPNDGGFEQAQELCLEFNGNPWMALVGGTVKVGSWPRRERARAVRLRRGCRSSLVIVGIEFSQAVGAHTVTEFRLGVGLNVTL